MPYENGGFVDYNILTNSPATQYRTINYNDYVIHDMEPYTTTINPDYINIPGWTPHIETIDEKLEKFAKKIYKIIEEHCNIDINEEEFIRLIKDDD